MYSAFLLWNSYKKREICYDAALIIVEVGNESKKDNV